MSLHQLYIRSAQAFIVVYSLTDLTSVNELANIRSQILRIKESEGMAVEDIPLVLCGNKADLSDQRQVSRDVGIRFSELWDGAPFCA